MTHIMISASVLGMVKSCPRTFFLQEALKLRAPPNAAMIKGSIIHKAIQNAGIQEQEIIKDGVARDPFIDMHKNALINAVGINKNNLRTVGVPLNDAIKDCWGAVLQVAERRLAQLQSSPTFPSQSCPALRSELRVDAEAIHIKGIIDRVELYPGMIKPLEFKTGSAPREGTWPGHRLQLGAYALMLREKYHWTIEQGSIIYLTKEGTEEREIVMNPFIEQEVAETVQKAMHILDEAVLPIPCPPAKNCIYCSASSFSPHIIDEKLREYREKISIQHRKL